MESLSVFSLVYQRQNIFQNNLQYKIDKWRNKTSGYEILISGITVKERKKHIKAFSEKYYMVKKRS